jgi:hypothetical protein
LNDRAIRGAEAVDPTERAHAWRISVIDLESQA